MRFIGSPGFDGDDAFVAVIEKLEVFFFQIPDGFAGFGGNRNGDDDERRLCFKDCLLLRQATDGTVCQEQELHLERDVRAAWLVALSCGCPHYDYEP